MEERLNKSDILLKIYSPEYGVIKIRDDISMQFAVHIIQAAKERLKHNDIMSGHPSNVNIYKIHDKKLDGHVFLVIHSII
jgi:hypothetical protein